MLNNKMEVLNENNSRFYAGTDKKEVGRTSGWID